MSRAMLVLNGRIDRERACKAIMACPSGSRVEIRAAKRTLPQNDRMWAMLTDVAQQKEHCGKRYTTDQWKVIFMHACGREVQFVPSLDQSTFIPFGYRSSELSKNEMSDLIECILSWGAQNGVVFHDPDSLASAERAA